MQDDRVGAFGGKAGTVLHHAMSASTLFTGLLIGLALLVTGGLFALADMPTTFAFFWNILMAFAFARFALNGVSGEWKGTVLSVTGGSWSNVARVALRYLLLSTTMLLGFVLLGFRPMMRPEDLQALMGPSGPTLIILALACMCATVLAQPLFLIVSVSADDLQDLVRPAHWRKIFHKRSSDVLTLYSIYIGGIVSAGFVSLIPVALISYKYPTLGLCYAVLAAAFLFGFMVTLLGRLCGFFVAQPGQEAAVESQADTAKLPAEPAGQDEDGHAAKPAAEGEVSPADPQGRVAQLRAAEKVEQAWRQFDTDKPGAIAFLEELSHTCADNPQVLHSLCLMKHQTEDVEGALEVARTAWPICFDQGKPDLAADIFCLLRGHFKKLSTSGEHLLTVAKVLRGRKDWQNAVNACAVALRSNPGDPRAVKGILQVGNALLYKEDSPRQALRVFAFLLQKCADSPLAEYMRQGKAEAERKLETQGTPLH